VSGSGSSTCSRRPHPAWTSVGMRAGVSEAVAVGWATAEEPALPPSLGAHRRHHHPRSCPSHLALRLSTEQHHQRLMHRTVQLHRTTSLGQPHLHPYRGKAAEHVAELIGVERPLVLPHHYSIKPPIPILGHGGALRSRPPA
jgi:hypothetical protein